MQWPFERGINEGSVEGKKEGSTQAAPEPKKELDWQDITIHRDGGGGGACGLLGQADLVKAAAQAARYWDEQNTSVMFGY